MIEIIDEKVKDRFTEIRTSYMINRICNYINRKKYKEHIAIISNFLKSVDEEYINKFVELFEKSHSEQIVGASKKEIYGSVKFFYEKPAIMSKKLGLSYYKFNNVYKDVHGRKFMTKEWLDSLEPVCDKKTLDMCELLNNFVDNFKYLAGEPYYNKYELFRSLEIEFYIIYYTLIKILHSNTVVEKFLYNICIDLEIDWGTISYLLRNVHLISRNNNLQMDGGKQFKQEIFNLMYLKGFNKGDVGEVIFNKSRSTYYAGSYNYLTKDITDNKWEFGLTYTPTLDWASINKDEVLNFIAIFRDFSNENL